MFSLHILFWLLRWMALPQCWYGIDKGRERGKGMGERGKGKGKGTGKGEMGRGMRKGDGRGEWGVATPLGGVSHLRLC